GPAPGWMAHARKDELEKAHTRRPGDNDVAYYYAHALMRDGDTSQAYRLMKDVVARDPQSVRNLSRLATYAAMTGHSVETVGIYRHILALDPNNAEAHAELGHIFGEAGLLTDALREYAQAVKLQ